MVELHSGNSPLRPYGIGKSAQTRDYAVLRHANPMRANFGALIDKAAFDDNHPYPAARTLPVIADIPLRNRAIGLGIVHRHGGHNDPIPNLYTPDTSRLKQIGIFHSVVPSGALYAALGATTYLAKPNASGQEEKFLQQNSPT
jgi:hypothetical protein